jgi:hypothetical protein
VEQSVKENIVRKLEGLPEPVLLEVLDFVEIVSQRAASGEDPILAVARTLSTAPLSATEIEQALYGEGK